MGDAYYTIARLLTAEFLEIQQDCLHLINQKRLPRCATRQLNWISMKKTLTSSKELKLPLQWQLFFYFQF